MSQYDNMIHSSDLDAFKNSGVIKTASITFSGSVGAGARQNQTTGVIAVDNPDYYQLLFDNSVQHSGKYKNVAMEQGRTAIHETTVGSDLIIEITAVITTAGIEIKGTMFNPYGSTISLNAVTLHFIYMPYEATI